MEDFSARQFLNARTMHNAIFPNFSVYELIVRANRIPTHACPQQFLDNHLRRKVQICAPYNSSPIRY